MSHEITPSNVKAFLEGNSKMAFDVLVGLPDYLKEQIEYRKSKCPDCLEAGVCKECGCKVPGKMYVTSSCNNGERFPDLMSESRWNEFKARMDEQQL